MKLKHSAIVASRWIIDEIGIALMTGSGFIDGTRKIHAVFCQRNSKGLIVANPHATVAVFIGEDERSPVYHLRLRHIPLSRQPALRVDGESNVLRDAGGPNPA